MARPPGRPKGVVPLEGQAKRSEGFRGGLKARPPGRPKGVVPLEEQAKRSAGSGWTHSGQATVSLRSAGGTLSRFMA